MAYKKLQHNQINGEHNKDLWFIFLVLHKKSKFILSKTNFV